MTSRRSSVSWVALVALALAGCGGGVDDAAGGAGGGPGGGGGEPNGEPTFYADVLPILQRSCLHCHSEGRIGGFSLATYEQARAQAGIIAAVTADGRMPPWHAVDTDVCQPQRPWLDDARLSDAEKATLRAWADTDAPEGDPADGPGDYQLPPTGLADPDLELEPANPSIVEGDVDQFTCVVYDPGLDADVFVEALNFEAGNAKVAHHALVFRVDRADAEALSGGDERFECFGAPGPDLIHAWAPGQTALELPPTVGMPLSPDQVIVVQMHYHPTGTSAEQDTSKIQLRFAAAEPEWEFTIALPGNASSAPQLLAGPNDGAEPEFTIPAGAEDHVERMVFEVPQLPADLPVLVVGTHMHYVGVDARFWIERPNPDVGEPAEECLVHTPAWDFNWQRGYQFDASIDDLPKLSGGDLLRLECHYDNSLKNPFVVQALEDQGLSAPQVVTLGEETLDEMCLGAIGFLVPHF